MANHIKNVAIVGVSGNSGRWMTEALLKAGKHTVTAAAMRLDSQSTFPDSVTIHKIDYDKPEPLVEAFRGQDALVITLSGQSPIQQIEEKLVRAAAEAEVPWILPNEWSPDTVNDVFILKPKGNGHSKPHREDRKELVHGSRKRVWYEWSFALPHGFGIDLVNHRGCPGKTSTKRQKWHLSVQRPGPNRWVGGG
ncbi:hypothetical protein EDD37DRAFT_653147 [Exophiala viscosa]|uniref:NAD(P)-binding domain-containing protein n=1 Tax=Exophiala viscosa TaxID=2486360 RepID=A0AAN6I8X0_9EURO|nr:hypothetical protein EDD36DRAFT_468673 [Exophiala viscosa]KAI1620833.1 hypothetical protein EDD37DRAFT_653147 [Exophiala viscosa]